MYDFCELPESLIQFIRELAEIWGKGLKPLPQPSETFLGRL